MAEEQVPVESKNAESDQSPPQETTKEKILDEQDKQIALVTKRFATLYAADSTSLTKEKTELEMLSKKLSEATHEFGKTRIRNHAKKNKEQQPYTVDSVLQHAEQEKTRKTKEKIKDRHPLSRDHYTWPAPKHLPSWVNPPEESYEEFDPNAIFDYDDDLVPVEQAKINIAEEVLGSGENTKENETIAADAITSPEKNLQVSYVFPIRGEISNLNFFFQLRDLSRQTGIAKDSYEVIYVRNNKPEDVALRNDAYEENNTLLAAIQYIKGETDTPPQNLNGVQKDILEFAKKSNLRIHTVMLPTRFFADRPGKNIERSRAYGQNIAKQRFESIGRNGAIVPLDGDMRIDPHATEEISKQLLSDSDAGMLDLFWDSIPGEGGELLFRTTFSHRFDFNNLLLYDLVQHKRPTFHFYAVKANSVNIFDPEEYTADTRDILTPLEDTGQIKHVNNVKIYTQDRAKPYNTAGGFAELRGYGLKNHSDHLFDKYNSKCVHPFYNILVELYNRDKDNPAIKEKTISLLQRYSPEHKRYPPEHKWVDEILQRIENGENLVQNVSAYDMDSLKVDPRTYAESLYHIFNELLTDQSKDIFEKVVGAELRREKLRQRLIQHNVRELLQKTYSLPHRDKVEFSDLFAERPTKINQLEVFLHQNTWILSELTAVRQEYSSPEEAYQWLQRKYPDFLSSFENTPYAYPNAVVLGVIKFLEEAREYPDELPDKIL